MKKSLFIFSLSLLFCYQASAGIVYNAAGKVTRLHLGSTGIIYVTTESPKINPYKTNDPSAIGCPKSTYVVPKEHAAYNEYYVMLLSAMDSGDDITLAIYDGGCANGHPSVLGVIRTK